MQLSKIKISLRHKKNQLTLFLIKEMMSQQEHDELLKRIKVETTDEYFEYGTNNNQAQTSRTEQQTQIEELFNSALVENLDTNEKVIQDKI